MLEAIDAVAAVDAAGGTGPARLANPRRGTDRRRRRGAAVAHLEEELGDLLFQVYFHATLAAEAGRFTLADVARGVHDKLVSRHPHVFGDVAAETPEDVAANWEAIKKAEKGRSSVTEGIPAALPRTGPGGQAAAQGRGHRHGAARTVADEAARVADEASRLVDADAGDGPMQVVADGEGGGTGPGRGGRGAALRGWSAVARALGVDPETALRSRAAGFRAEVEARG